MIRGDAARARVLVFVAMGGEGKTALVADWAARREAAGWEGFEAAFAWSFYSQGTREQFSGDSDLFLAAALAHFGAPAKEGESGVDKAKRLAGIIAARRALLLLDGLEPLQYPAGAPHDGRLKDDAIYTLLRLLAIGGKALTLVTTRVPIQELKAAALKETARQHDLSRLSTEAGAALLAQLGVKGSRAECAALVEEVDGHALTLNMLGAYLKRAFHGDIRLFDRIDWERASRQYKNDHAFRAMATYEKFLSRGDAGGAREIAVMRLLGLFDRPADSGCWRALLAEKIAGLNEALVEADEEERDTALDNLGAEKLLTVERDGGGGLIALDAHPLLREYFAKELKEKNPAGWRAAHKRLYEHLCATQTDQKEAPSLDDLRPLYQAVAHGCHAGLQQEACDHVYTKRILRGTGSDGFYSTKKLGAIGADLGAVACFFDAPWKRLSPNLSAGDQAWLLNEAAFSLRALGRTREALEPMRAALAARVASSDWKNASASASNLSALALTLGEIAEATRAGAEAVAYAERSDDAFQRMIGRTAHADALHQSGARDAALALFVEAEQLQAEWQKQYPLLYSMQGFRYCELLPGEAARAASALVSRAALCEGPSDNDDRSLRFARDDDARSVTPLLDACGDVEKRAQQTLAFVIGKLGRLTIALDHLTLARAALYAAILRDERPECAHVEKAVNGLRAAGSKEHLNLGLLTRALYRAVIGEFDGARDDLDEAFDIADRGPMKLYLADIHLSRARLFGLCAGRPAEYPWVSPQDDLAKARRLIESCGYGRRLPELLDAEAALAAQSRNEAPGGGG